MVPRNQRNIVVLFLLAIIILATSYGFIGLRVGYISGYQGLQPTFHSIYYKDYWYDRTHKGPNPNYDDNVASACAFFDHVNFDADENRKLLPNLHASMGPVTVDRETDPKRYGPWRIKVGEETVSESNETHEWTRTIETYKEFEILRYKCDWSVNIWMDGDGNERDPLIAESTYSDLELWLKVEPQRFVYFKDNPDEVYFAPALFQLSQDAEWWHLDSEDRKHEDPRQAGKQDIFPEAQGETLGIFYARGGGEVNIQDKVLSYQGLELDPEIFREEYWIRFAINRFRPTSYWNPLRIGYTVELPSVQLKFLIYVFVVGEWTVKLYTDEVKPLNPHMTQWGISPWVGLGKVFSNILRNPFAWLFMFLIVIALIAIFAPGVLVGLFALFGQRRRGGA